MQKNLALNQKIEVYIFKYKILRQIYSPIKEDRVWRREQNGEVGELVGEPDKVEVI